MEVACTHLRMETTIIDLSEYPRGVIARDNHSPGKLLPGEANSEVSE